MSIFLELILEKKQKFGPARLAASQLKLATVKVGFDQAELDKLDARRGHYPRSAFLRAAGLDQKLKALPAPESVTTWASTNKASSADSG